MSTTILYSNEIELDNISIKASPGSIEFKDKLDESKKLDILGNTESFDEYNVQNDGIINVNSENKITFIYTNTTIKDINFTNIIDKSSGCIVIKNLSENSHSLSISDINYVSLNDIVINNLINTYTVIEYFINNNIIYLRKI